MEILKEIGPWFSRNAFTLVLAVLALWVIYSRFGYLILPEKEDPNSPLLHLTAANWQKEVLESNRPVLVDFWAPWCPPCRAQGPVVACLAEKVSRTAKVGKLDVDQEPGLAQQFGVSGIPSLLVFKNGKVVRTFVGFTSEGELQKALE